MVLAIVFLYGVGIARHCRHCRYNEQPLWEKYSQNGGRELRDAKRTGIEGLRRVGVALELVNGQLMSD